MDVFPIKFRVAHKGLPPRPIRLEVPGWAGDAAHKRENGSEPQPWHCLPFGEGASSGLELLYQYETECHVINDNGELRIDWDYQREPGGVVGYDEFSESAPKPARFYVFATSVDVQAPPGYVVQTEPHPRYFTDATATVPLAICGQVRTAWWPKKLFVVFKAPAPGQRHIFRKGEPYVKLLVVPQVRYEPQPMTPAEETQRRELEDGILLAKSFIARHVWHNPEGLEFNDHYRVLLRAFEQEGLPGVERLVKAGVERYQQVVPPGRPMSEYLNLALQYQREGKHLEAKQVLLYTQNLDAESAEAANLMGILGWTLGLRDLAVLALRRAVGLQPRSPAFQANLGELLRLMGRFEEAEAALRATLDLTPQDPQVLSNLGLALAGQGRPADGLEACRAALALDPRLPLVHFRLGLILARQNQIDEARQCFQAALALDATYADALRELNQLPVN